MLDPDLHSDKKILVPDLHSDKKIMVPDLHSDKMIWVLDLHSDKKIRVLDVHSDKKIKVRLVLDVDSAKRSGSNQTLYWMIRPKRSGSDRNWISCTGYLQQSPPC